MQQLNFYPPKSLPFSFPVGQSPGIHSQVKKRTRKESVSQIWKHVEAYILQAQRMRLAIIDQETSLKLTLQLSIGMKIIHSINYLRK
jgi:hypothetical protein